VLLAAVSVPDKVRFEIVGLVPNTKEPEPVSSEITPLSCKDVVAANTDKLSDVLTSVADVGMVVPLIDVAVATPNTGVTSVGVLANTREPVPVSSEITPANSAEVVEARALNLSVVTTNVLDVGIVVELMVKPAILLYVVADEIVVLPRVGAE